MHTLKRQLAHWLYAAESLAHVENMASDDAWKGLHDTTAVIMKQYLQNNISHLVNKGKKLQDQLIHINTNEVRGQLRKAILRYKADYLKIETTIHFYTDAINTRTNSQTALILKGCDVLCNECLHLFLTPLNKLLPAVISYLDKGAGAAIMKAGLRLWDGSLSPAALIKITFHNLRQPTALLHECGHQIAHVLHWNKELSKTLFTNLEYKDKAVAKAFSNWSSEIAADAIALVTTGFAAVAALHDVVDGEGGMVFHYDANDPHPISYLRVLLNCAFCNCLFGKGSWDDMTLQWKQNHPLTDCDEGTRKLIIKATTYLPLIAEVILKQPQIAFGNKAISSLINISKVAPITLGKLNDAYVQNPNYVQNCTALQMVALTGYRVGIGIGNVKTDLKNMQNYLIKIGNQNIQHYSLN